MVFFWGAGLPKDRFLGDECGNLSAQRRFSARPRQPAPATPKFDVFGKFYLAFQRRMVDRCKGQSLFLRYVGTTAMPSDLSPLPAWRYFSRLLPGRGTPPRGGRRDCLDAGFAIGSTAVDDRGETAVDPLLRGWLPALPAAGAKRIFPGLLRPCGGRNLCAGKDQRHGLHRSGSAVPSHQLADRHYCLAQRAGNPSHDESPERATVSQYAAASRLAVRTGRRWHRQHGGLQSARSYRLVSNRGPFVESSLGLWQDGGWGTIGDHPPGGLRPGGPGGSAAGADQFIGHRSTRPALSHPRRQRTLKTAPRSTNRRRRCRTANGGTRSDNPCMWRISSFRHTTSPGHPRRHRPSRQLHWPRPRRYRRLTLLRRPRL